MVAFLLALPLPAATPRIEEVQLSLAQKHRVDTAPLKIINFVVSSERIAKVTSGTTHFEVSAEEYGAATVTCFLEQGEILILRLVVKPVFIQSPPVLTDSPLSADGTLARVGTQFGFQSPNGFLESLVQQEEFLSVHWREREKEASFSLRSVAPLQYADPRPVRTIEHVEATWRQRGSVALRAGDYDLNHTQRGSRGMVRGLRTDLDIANAKISASLGFARIGVNHFFLGDEPSWVVGFGWSRDFSRSVQLVTELIGFEKNSHLQVASSGLEWRAKLRLTGEALRQLEISLTGDRQARLGAEGSALFSLGPVEMSVAAAVSPDQHEVFSLPTRFSAATETNAATISVASPSMPLAVGLSASRVVQFSSVDLYPGQSVTKSYSAQLSSQGLPQLRWQLGLHRYDLEFSSFNRALAFTETQNRYDVGGEWDLSPEVALSLTGEWNEMRSPLRQIGYRSEIAFAGLRYHWGEETGGPLLRDPAGGSLHLQTGAGRFTDLLGKSQEGWYWVNRLTPRLVWPRWNLSGLLQHELRVDGTGHSNSLRAQAALQWHPLRQHELGLNLFRQFDWLRAVYRDIEGVTFQYVYHFGSKVAAEDPFATWRRHGLAVKVRQESGEPIANAQIELLDQGRVIKNAVSDLSGNAVLENLPAGDYSVRLQLPAAFSRFRLLSANPRELKLPGDGGVEFVASQSSELRVSVWEQGTQRPLSDVQVQWRRVGEPLWQVMPAEGDRFRLAAVLPGKLQVRIAPESLPGAFRLDSLIEQEVLLGQNDFREIELMAEPERAVSGRLFIDKNRNRRYDPNEKGLDGKMVRLGQWQVRTGEGGQFIFRHLSPFVGVVRWKGFASEEVRVLPQGGTTSDVWVPVTE